jgi:hypothetical protein
MQTCVRSCAPMHQSGLMMTSSSGRGREAGTVSCGTLAPFHTSAIGLPAAGDNFLILSHLSRLRILDHLNELGGGETIFCAVPSHEGPPSSAPQPLKGREIQRRCCAGKQGGPIPRTDRLGLALRCWSCQPMPSQINAAVAEAAAFSPFRQSISNTPPAHLSNVVLQQLCAPASVTSPRVSPALFMRQ